MEGLDLPLGLEALEGCRFSTVVSSGHAGGVSFPIFVDLVDLDTEETVLLESNKKGNGATYSLAMIPRHSFGAHFPVFRGKTSVGGLTTGPLTGTTPASLQGIVSRPLLSQNSITHAPNCLRNILEL